jgi:hypothetical protein
MTQENQERQEKESKLVGKIKDIESFLPTLVPIASMLYGTCLPALYDCYVNGNVNAFTEVNNVTILGMPGMLMGLAGTLLWAGNEIMKE